MNKTELINKLKEVKGDIKEKFPVSNLYLFGSYSLNKASEDSDVDLLVEFSEPVGWKFFELQRYLKDKLNKEVDLVTKQGIKSEYKNSILNSAEQIWKT